MKWPRPKKDVVSPKEQKQDRYWAMEKESVKRRLRLLQSEIEVMRREY